MSIPLALILIMVVLYAVGIYLLLDRSLTRILLGFLLVGNATNLLLFITSGSFGAAPIVGDDSDAQMSDPLPQAFILTSIVITFGISAFILALIYRAWNLSRVTATDSQDEVVDDEHDVTLGTAESITTEEVTDEEIAATPEFDDEQAEEEAGA